MKEQITLQKLIDRAKDESITLTDKQKESLFNLFGKGCRQKNRERLWRRLDMSLSLWPNYGIFGRVHLEDDGRFSYCAGQSYPDEVRTVRELILKG